MAGAEPIVPRPDPEELLRQANAEAAREHRGRLKIFFGASAGVGKTYTMLKSARQLQAQGIDVLVGLVETHGRAETEELLAGLDLLPRRQVLHRDRALEEFDLDATLARHPAVVLVDELAHTNAPGMRHAKRWQDVEELLASGIDVHSTLNVQHLESLNDVVGQITGIRVWETVPDRFFDSADEIVLVDLPADDLLQRLREGKVYLPEQAERAIRNFFRKGNLIALRELALRRTADRVDDDVHLYRREMSDGRVWHMRERLLACVGPAPGSDQVLRSASRLASAINAEWHTVFVETPALQHRPANERVVMLGRLKLAQDLGAITASVTGNDVVEALVGYARKHNVTKIVLGRTQHRWFSFTPDLPGRIAALAPDIDVVLIARDDTARHGPKRPVPATRWTFNQESALHYGVAAAVCALTTLLAYPMFPALDRTNVAMLYLAGVLPVALLFGRGPAVFAAVLNVIAFDVFFVAPQFSLAVADAQYLVTFMVMLAVGLLTANLTAGLRFQARMASSRETRVQDLYQLARELSGALTNDQITDIVRRGMDRLFGATATLLLPSTEDRLHRPEVAVEGLDLGVAQWCYDRGAPAGAGTDTLPGTAVHYLPLKAPMRVRGVLAVLLDSPRTWFTPERQQQLDTISALAAIVLERVHFVAVAQETLVKIESERLRESLLAALSHDLRTPLTSLAGLAEALAQQAGNLAPAQRESIETIYAQAQGMVRLVTNLMDMARLESGQTPLRPDWLHLEELVGAARSALGSRLAAYPVQVEIPEDFPLLHGDAVLLEQVLVNLLENSVKYAPAGTAIGIRAKAADGTAEITVWDEGPGLPAGPTSQLFEKFVRGRPESRVAGVGLGLAICRAILEAHGGSIVARNRPEGGAAFVMRLPLKAMPALEPEPPEPEETA